MLIVFIKLSIDFFSINFKILKNGNKTEWIKTEATIDHLDSTEIVYSYSSNNKDYSSKKSLFDKNKNSNKYYYKLYNRLKTEKKFYIFINPENPKESVIFKYNFEFRKFGSFIITTFFSLFLGLIILDNFKYPASYISKKIKLIK